MITEKEVKLALKNNKDFFFHCLGVSKSFLFAIKEASFDDLEEKEFREEILKTNDVERFVLEVVAHSILTWENKTPCPACGHLMDPDEDCCDLSDEWFDNKEAEDRYEESLE